MSSLCCLGPPRRAVAVIFRSYFHSLFQYGHWMVTAIREGVRPNVWDTPVPGKTLPGVYIEGNERLFTRLHYASLLLDYRNPAFQQPSSRERHLFSFSYLTKSISRGCFLPPIILSHFSFSSVWYQIFVPRFMIQVYPL